MSRILLRGAALFLFALLALLPVASLLVEAFRVEGRLSLGNFATVLTEGRQWGLLGRSLLLGLGSAVGAFLLGFPYGFLVARTDTPGRRMFAALAVGPLLLPPLVHAIAWNGMTGASGPGAAIAVFALGSFPLVAVLSARAFERVDARREEAALLAGGGRARLALSSRLALPAGLVGALCVFVFAVSDFAVPDFLTSVGRKFSVYADEIFTRWQRRGSSGQAVAAALPICLLSGAGLLALAGLRRRGASLTVGGDFVPPPLLSLGRGRAPALAFLLAVGALSFGIPIARLAWVAGSLGTVRAALAEARFDVANTMLASTLAAALASVLALLLAHLALRARPPIARAIEVGALLPLAVPAIAMAVALIRLWNRGGLPGLVYTGVGVVVAALAGRYFAFPYHAAATGLAPLDPSLEEAAQGGGIPFGRRLLGIVAPLAGPSLATAFVLTFVFGMRELDTIVLIPSGNRSVMFRIYNAIHFSRPAFVAALSLVLAFLTALPLLLYRLLAGRRLEIGA
ncbi:MAG TPA: ABC transporter permease subunit [Planctomycetota bacterium]|nr:ABC transporter permease subunit [Planctomycetota bacterium]